MSREVQRAYRRLADLNSARLRDIPASPMFDADVLTVTPGAGAGGVAQVTVLWRTGEYVVRGYPDSYTPVVGHRVLCALVANQVRIICHSIG